MSADARPRPLEGVTVLDLTTALAGPYATLLLVGLGARVIKIERPGSGDVTRGHAPYLGADGATLDHTAGDSLSVPFLARGRGKLSATLNLKHPDATGVFAALARTADVVVENFSAGTVDRLGVGYEQAQAANPAIVYCSINGFGLDGPSTTEKAYDSIIQALSGVMMTSGLPSEGPVRIGVPLADLSAPLFGVIGILAALNQRDRTGQGQHLDVSMLGALTSLVSTEPFELLERIGIPARTGNAVPRLAPFGLFAAADGHVAICAPTDAFCHRLCAVMGAPELMEDERFADHRARVANADTLHTIVGGWTVRHPAADIVARLRSADVPVAEVREPQEAVRDPRVLERGETVRLTDPDDGTPLDAYGPGLPIRFSGAEHGFDRPAPALGEHNAEVYGRAGYSEEELRELAERGIV